jgi:hypothetical protein
MYGNEQSADVYKSCLYTGSVSLPFISTLVTLVPPNDVGFGFLLVTATFNLNFQIQYIQSHSIDSFPVTVSEPTVQPPTRRHRSVEVLLIRDPVTRACVYIHSLIDRFPLCSH